jgi:hypothetical protein
MPPDIFSILSLTNLSISPTCRRALSEGSDLKAGIFAL